MDIIVKEGLTIDYIKANANNLPEEVVGAGLDVLKNIKAQIRDAELTMSASLIRRMREENATKLPFIGVDGKEKVLTVKKGAMKLNPAIKNWEDYITQAGFAPEMFGQYKFSPDPWNVAKEKRKVGGNTQLLCDEMYIEGQPSITIEEK